MTSTRRRPRQAGSSSTESSDAEASTDDDEVSTPAAGASMQKSVELTLKDDEDTIRFQAPLPDDDG